MTDDEEKMKKMRGRMERDVYSVLLSFKEGATPMQLDKRMDETLGYTYKGKYHTAGLYDMTQLLREHAKVRQIGADKFKIIPTEEVSDLVALIAKQKEGKGKKKGGKARRPVTSAGYRSSYGVGISARTSPKTGGFRSVTSMPKNHYTKSQPQNYYTNHYQPRPTTSASFCHPSTSSGGFGGNNHSFNQNRPRYSHVQPTAPTVQRPLTAAMVATRCPLVDLNSSTSCTQTSSSSKRISTSSPAPSIDRVSQHSETVKPTSKACQMPSIKEFSDNSKKMMLKMYPRTVHLSEMTELYSQEYGITVDPLQVFSKSWKMLVLTTFKEWLEMSEGECGLKKEWAKKNGKTDAPRPIPIIKSTAPESSVPTVRTIPTVRAQPTAPDPLPKLQGFRYQIPSSPKSPIDVVVQKMKGLTVGARHTLPTPEKPPGLTREVDTIPPMKSSLKTNTTMTERPKTSMMHSKPSIFAGLRPITASAFHHQNKMKTVATNTSASESLIMHNSPSSSSETLPSNPSSASPPLAPPVRMRPIQTTPSTRLFGRALADVKKQEVPTSRPVMPSAKPLYISSTTTPTALHKQVGRQPTQFMTAVAEDQWDESCATTRINESRAPSIVGRRPTKLPPMSKGAKPTSSHLSACSSRASSRGRTAKLLEEAVQSSLPDSEEDRWY